ncbi:MAG TPA: hypothetical protein VGC84_04565 [Ilumatobacteraceae bacterium]
MKRHLIGAAAIVLGTALVGGLSVQTAAAVDPPAVPTTVTLPMFGVPLSIGIATGPGGALTEVTVDPTSNTATSASPHKVVFMSANPAAGGAPAKVVVRSKHGGLSVSARAGSLADFAGTPGGWTGDLFGDGVASSVTFSVADLGGGAPDITGIGTSGATATVGTVEHSTDDDGGMSARVSVMFTNTAGDQSRSVTIKVKVGTDEDGNPSAKLSISLGRLQGVAIDAAKAVGHHTWKGVLCDNSPATIDYDVAIDGSVSGVTATPAGADVRTDDSGKIDVRFSHNERVRIRVREDGGMIKISVDERIRCDSADPTFNGSVVPNANDDNNGDNDNNGGHHGGHNDDDDTTTTTTTAP